MPSRKKYYAYYNAVRRTRNSDSFMDWFEDQKIKLEHDYDVLLSWSDAFRYVDREIDDYLRETRKYKSQAIRDLVRKYVKSVWKKHERK